MAPIGLPGLLLLPLRKFAIVPAILLGGVGVGALYGSWDLARIGARVVFRPETDPIKRRPGTDVFAHTVSIFVMAAAISAREMALPAVPPPPEPRVPATTWMARARGAWQVTQHVLIHYPYRHRFNTVFSAGMCGGLAFVATEWFYQRHHGGKGKGTEPAQQSAPPIQHTRQETATVQAQRSAASQTPTATEMRPQDTDTQTDEA